MKNIKTIRFEAKNHFASVTFDGIEEVIEDMVKRGYTYKGYVPYKLVGYGCLKEIVIIFEQDY